MKRYKLILADPPWKYRSKHSSRGFKHGAIDKYPTMTLQQICDFPVPKIAMEDCALFLWITVPLLPDGFKVMRYWGFKYKTAIFWRKIMSMGLGHWFRGQVEVCLLGIKGNIKAFKLQRPNFIQSKARKHSQKPEEMYGIIESLNLQPKIELFARHRREGWDCWGNELPNTIQKLLP